MSGNDTSQPDPSHLTPRTFSLLAIVDSPTLNTGFACVGKNLLPRWSAAGYFARLDVWGIGYTGWPHEFPWRIFPGGFDWTSPDNTMRLMNQILEGGYTHVWILSDTFLMSRAGFAQNLKIACRESGAKLVVYFPVDAPQEKSWLKIARVADAAVTYTEYGRREVERADALPDALAGKTGRMPVPLKPESANQTGKMPVPLKPFKVGVIPHGVDTSVFKPVPGAKCQVSGEEPDTSHLTLRTRYFPAWAGPENFIMVNVNRNERRKALAHSLQVLAELKKVRGAKCQVSGQEPEEPDPSHLIPRTVFRLYLHTPIGNSQEQTDLRVIGKQLGLAYGVDWVAPPAEAFEHGLGLFSEAVLNEIYNASDLMLTTTLGEGWGLSITEAAAAGLTVVCPAHTSCREIAERFLEADDLNLNLNLNPDLPEGESKIKIKSKNGEDSRARQFILAPLSPTAVVNTADNSRVRYPVDVVATARLVADRAELGIGKFPPLAGRLQDWLSWDRIAEAWLEVFLAVSGTGVSPVSSETETHGQDARATMPATA